MSNNQILFGMRRFFFTGLIIIFLFFSNFFIFSQKIEFKKSGIIEKKTITTSKKKTNTDYSPMLVSLGIYSQTGYILNSTFNKDMNDVSLNGFHTSETSSASIHSNSTIGGGLFIRHFFTYIPAISFLGLEIYGNYNFFENAKTGYLPQGIETNKIEFSYTEHTSINIGGSFQFFVLKYHKLGLLLSLGFDYTEESFVLHENIAGATEDISVKGVGYGGTFGLNIEYKLFKYLNFFSRLVIKYQPIQTFTSSKEIVRLEYPSKEKINYFTATKKDNFESSSFKWDQTGILIQIGFYGYYK